MGAAAAGPSYGPAAMHRHVTLPFYLALASLFHGQPL